MTNPFLFELLFTNATKRWERWSRHLVNALRASQVYTAEGSEVRVEAYGPDGALIGLTRDIPALIQARTGAGGLPARDAGTGAWGSATVTLYTSAGDADVLGTATDTAWNRTTVTVPANTDLWAWESGGRLFYLGHVCP